MTRFLTSLVLMLMVGCSEDNSVSIQLTNELYLTINTPINYKDSILETIYDSTFNPSYTLLCGNNELAHITIYKNDDSYNGEIPCKIKPLEQVDSLSIEKWKETNALLFGRESQVTVTQRNINNRQFYVLNIKTVQSKNIVRMITCIGDSTLSIYLYDRLASDKAVNSVKLKSKI